MLKRVLIGLGAIFMVVVLIAGIILFRTFTFGGNVEVQTVELADVPDFDGEEIAKRLSTAIQIRTQTVSAGDPRPGQEGPWLEFREFMTSSYPELFNTAETNLIDDHTVLVRWAGRDETLDPILMMAHQDVVPVNMGTMDDWDASPFSGAIQDGYVYGRGTMDDKGSLVTILEAANALVASGYQPTRTIWMLFGHDEEVSGSGAQSAVDYFERENIRMEMVLDEGFFVIDPFPLTGSAVALIGIAEKGYVTIRVTARAAGGHSSVPPRNSAGVQLAKAILALDENQVEADFTKPPISQMLSAVAEDMPFTQRMAFANLWLFRGMVEGEFAKSGEANAIIRTTTAPTMMAGAVKENVLPQQATALINFRLHPNDSIESVLQHVRDVTSEIDGVTSDIAEASGIGSEASPVSPTSNRAYAVLASVAREASGGAPVAPALVLGATDSRWTTEISDSIYRFVPTVIPSSDVGGMHGTNERISIENLERMARGYAQIMVGMSSE